MEPMPREWVRQALDEGTCKGLSPTLAFDLLCLRWAREHGHDPEFTAEALPPVTVEPLPEYPRIVRLRKLT